MSEDDVKVSDVKRAVCRHGVVNELRFEAVRTETSYTMKATERICQECLTELAQSMAVFPI